MTEQVQQEAIFVDGMIFKLPHPNAPEFVKGSLSLKIEDLTKFMTEHNNNGWVNIDLKVSRGGKGYAALNTWKPDATRQANPPTTAISDANKEEEVSVDDIPF